jgi:hypothetical protein
MMAAILFVVSMVAFCQFGIYYWRATIAATAESPVSDRVRYAAGISASSLGPCDFRAILKVHDLTPALSGSAEKFRTIRTYYSLVESLGHLIPWVATWAEGEMSIGTRYMAVLVDQRLERNLACADHIRSM